MFFFWFRKFFLLFLRCCIYVFYSPLFAPWALVSMQELFPYLFGN